MFLDSFVYTFLASVAALFPVMNPVGNSFVVNGFFTDLDAAQRRAASKKIVRNCLIVGLGTLAVGHLVMLLFGLAVPVIQVAGGIVICKTGLEWLSSKPASPAEKHEQVAKEVTLQNVESKLFYPLSFPICLGPGSVSVIFTLMATASTGDNLLRTGINYAIISIAIVALLMVLYFGLLNAHRIMKRLGAAGNLIIGKLLAFITFCIGIQIILSGISKIFHIEIL